MTPDAPGIHYARANDGAYIAYQVLGDGPVDLAWQFDFYGNIDVEWESPYSAALYSALASFSRLILHDRRATGLSSRNFPVPDLETRAGDLIAVLDAVGAETPVLAGINESGAFCAFVAATTPARTRGIVWHEPRARPVATSDYPWSWDGHELQAEMRALDHWGTRAYATNWSALSTLSFQAPVPEAEVRHMVKSSRQTCTPDVARELTRIWCETDVRPLLPSVQLPTLLIVESESDRKVEEARHIASLIPNSELAIVPSAGWASTVEGIEPVVGEIRRFVGAEPPALGMETVLTTVLFTDIVGSTEQQVSLGDHRYKQLIERHHATIRGSLDRWRGVEVDTAGDGFYATFDGPARAIRSALEIIEGVRDLGIDVRAGVHTGECEFINAKIGGLAVTIGARVAGLAGPSEVLISQTVKDLVAGSGLVFEDAGEHKLKGVPDRWRLYRVTK